MPSADEFWSAASEVVSERGYLVIGFSEGSEQPELGTTLDNVLGFEPRGAITIVGNSDWTDWKEQVETFYRIRPTWGRGKSGDAKGKYYRVKFAPDFKSTDVSPTATVNSTSLSSTLTVPRDVPSFSGYARMAGSLFRFLLTTAAGGRPPDWVLVRFSHHQLPLYFANLCGYVAYQTICTSVCGSTLGKRLLSLQVVQDDGSRCRPRSAIIRELAFFIDSFFFGVVGYTAMRANDQHKRYGDWWADTIVRKIAKASNESRHESGRFMLGFAIGVMADIALVITGLVIMMLY